MSHMGTIWRSGRESKYLDDIIAGRKTVEGRLKKGKFALYRVGDIIALRRDIRDADGILHDGEPGQARVMVVAIRQYATFFDMVTAEGYANVIPEARSAAEAAETYNRFYSAEDEARYGVLGIVVKHIE